MLAMPNTANLPHTLERNILIRASRDTVFRYFTDSQRWAKVIRENNIKVE